MKQELEGPACCTKISEVEKMHTSHLYVRFSLSLSLYLLILRLKAVFGFFDKADSPEVRTFRSLENSQLTSEKDIGFGEITSPSLCKHYRYHQQVVLFIKSTPYIEYDGDLKNLTQLMHWLRINTVPPPTELTAVRFPFCVFLLRSLSFSFLFCFSFVRFRFSFFFRFRFLLLFFFLIANFLLG